MTRHKTDLTDEELDERDSLVRADLLSVIKYKRDLAGELRRTSEELLKDARNIEQAVKAEQWHNLEEYLDEDVIESLSDVSPTDLLG